MSYLDKLHQSALTAATYGRGTGANKGYWEVQLRDDEGLWMEMGRGAMFDVINADGSTETKLGVSIGPSDKTPGNVRIMVAERDGSKNTYDVPAHTVRQFDAKIHSKELERQGIKNIKGDQVGDNVKMEANKIEDLDVKPSTPEDEDLSTLTPNDEERKIIEDARAKSPLAKLPAGAEKQMTPEELAEAVGGPAPKDTPGNIETADRKAANAKSVDATPVGSSIKVKDRLNMDGKGGAEQTWTRTGDDEWTSGSGTKRDSAFVKGLADGQTDVTPEKKATESKDPMADAQLTPLDSNDEYVQEYSNDLLDSKDPVASVTKGNEGYQATNYLTGEMFDAKSEAEAKQWIADEFNGTHAAQKDAERQKAYDERNAADAAERAANKATPLSKKEFINKVIESAYDGYEPGMPKPRIPEDWQINDAYDEYETAFRMEERDSGQVDKDIADDIYSEAVATIQEDPFGLDDDLATLWNDAAYGDGADFAKIEKSNKSSDFITNDDVIGASKVYALDDIKKGDYFYDTKTSDILKATEDARWNADKTAVEVPAVDASGSDRSLEVANDKPAVEKINYKAPAAKPVSQKSPAPVEDTTPSDNAPEMPDTAVSTPVSDVKEGDDLFTINGTYLGKLTSKTATKDAQNKSVIRLKYTDETGRTYNVPYPLDTKFNVVRLPEEAAPADSTPEVPAAPEAPATPAEVPATPEVPAEAPATPTAPTTPARKSVEDMTASELVADIKAKLDKADASKGAVAGFFEEVRAILENPALTDSEKLSAVAKSFQLARTEPRPAGSFGGDQFGAMRQIMFNLDKVGVPEASREYEKTLIAAKVPLKQLSADDGLPIAPASKSNEEMYDLDVEEVHDQDGNLLPDLNGDPIYHANAILNAIINQNPNAKLKDDGGLVIERDKFTDHDGKDYNYEITLYPTFGGQIMERYTITDLDGNPVEDFMHADYKDSIKGLYAAKNGVMVFRDQLLGRKMPPGKVTPEKISYFGKNKTLANRMTFFRGKGITNKDSKLIRIRDLDETISYYLEGRDREFSRVSKKAKSAHVRGSVAQSFVASFYEAFELGDGALMKERLVQLLGRLPDNAESRTRLISTLKTEMTKRYKGTNLGSKIGLTVQNLDKWMATEGVDLRNLAKIPYVSADGTTPVQVGDKVRAYGNEDQVMVGIVTRLNKRTGSGGAYKDTVAIKFRNGEVINIFASRNTEILHDEHPDADAPLDNYEPWIRGDDMRKIRLGDEPALNDTYLGFTGSSDAPDAADPNAGTPYLGSDGSSGGSKPPSDNGTKAEDLTPGSAWHSEDGDYLGSVIEVVEVPAEDGGEPGIAVVYVDADGIEQAEVVDKGTVRLPK